MEEQPISTATATETTAHADGGNKESQGVAEHDEEITSPHEESEGQVLGEIIYTNIYMEC